MTVGSLCSGISADSVAWGPLGWKHLFFSEIDPFCRKVLAHHWPEITNYGDFTTQTKAGFPAVDVLMVSTPCQDFSVAGRRDGMGGSRGSLTMSAIGVLEAIRPRWLVFENVPGLLQSNCSLGFRGFLSKLADCGYGFSYRILDAQYAGLAQRRERVFLVGYLGDWRPAAAVFLDDYSLQGNPPPSRESRQGDSSEVARCLNAGATKRLDWESETFVAHTLLGKCGRCQVEDTYIPIGFYGNCSGQDATDNLMSTLRAHDALCSDGPGAVHFRQGVRRLTPREAETIMGFPVDFTMIPTHRKRQPEAGKDAEDLYAYYTQTERGRLYVSMADGRVISTPDGPRYRCLGNSIAVPVLRWIGERIELVESLLSNIGPENS